MAFAIKFTEQGGPDKHGHQEKASWAVITINDFTEKLLIPLGFWSKSDYEKQWLTAIKDILSETRVSSALITGMFDPKKANFINCWPLYRDGKAVYIQERIIFLEELTHEFKLDKLSEYVGDRETTSDDGEFISEWKITTDDIKKFI